MPPSKPLVTAAELEALIHNWGASPNKSIDKFYPARLIFNFVVMALAAFWLLIDSENIARTLSVDADNIERIKNYLYFRGWFVLGILTLGCYAYFQSWYPAIVFSCCLLIGAMNLVSDLFTIYPERLANPTPILHVIPACTHRITVGDVHVGQERQSHASRERQDQCSSAA